MSTAAILLMLAKDGHIRTSLAAGCLILRENLKALDDDSPTLMQWLKVTGKYFMAPVKYGVQDIMDYARGAQPTRD